MSATYFIAPFDPIHWQDEDSPGVESSLVINFQHFSEEAITEWPSFKSFPTSWEISVDDNVELGGGFIGVGNQILILQGPGPLFNRFVAWYRKYISLEYPLFLFAEGSWNRLELTDDITEMDVRAFTGYV